MTFIDRILAAIVLAAMMVTHALPAFAQSSKCHDKAVATVDTAARREKEGGEAIASFLLFGMVGLAINTLSNADSKEKAIAALEKACSEGRDISAPAKKSPEFNANTAPGANRACTNTATSCKGALAFCMRNCDERNRGRGCSNDCKQASSSCDDTGTWKTTNCLKTGMKQ